MLKWKNFIKINNEDIKNNELNNNLPLFCFLMFNINDRNELCTSINKIAYEFKYKLNSKNTNGIQSSIKSELIKMSEKNKYYKNKIESFLLGCSLFSFSL